MQGTGTDPIADGRGGGVATGVGQAAGATGSSGQSRNVSWDLIRVVAVAAVVIGHVSFLGPTIMPGIAEYPVEFALRVGAAALVVLSAYFACVTIRRSEPGWWLRRRLARLLPAYVAAVLVTYVVSRFAVLAFNGWQAPPGVFGLLFGHPDVSTADGSGPPAWHLPGATELITNLTLIQPWSADWAFLDNSYWTLPLQVMGFIAAAVLWRKRLTVARMRIVARWLVLVSAVATPLLLAPGPLAGARDTLAGGLGIRYGYLFGIGVLIWLWSRRQVGTTQLTLLTAIGVVLHAAATEYPIRAGIAFAVMLAMIAVAARGVDVGGRAARVLRRPAAWLAGISYGVYLVHQQLGYILARALSDAGMPGWPRLLAVFAAVIIGGWLLTLVVERPMYRMLTSRRQRRPRTVGVLAAVTRPALAPAGPGRLPGTTTWLQRPVVRRAGRTRAGRPSELVGGRT